MSTIAGIDLGNSRVKVAILDEQGNAQVLGNELGELFTHSAVYFDDERIIVGTEALNAGLADASRFVSNWKRHMGTSEVLYKGKAGEYRAKDIAQILLEHVASTYEKKTGCILSQAAVTVPAQYTDQQKAETKEAGKAAGIEVELMPHEPTAAIFGNNVHKRDPGIYAILDLGGGTYDVSLVRVSGNNAEVLATGGDAKLGGQDFNARLKDYVLDRFESEHALRPVEDSHPLELQELAQRIEQCKLSLSARDSVTLTFACAGKVLSETITREQFRALVRDLTDRAMSCTEQAIADAGISKEEIKELIPVGGASQMPAFLDAIEASFGKKASYHAEPFYAVALGCVTMARLARESSGESTVINGRRLPPLEQRVHDVTNHPIGVCCVDFGKAVCRVILPKGTPIPSDLTKAFQLAEEGQTGARIELLQAKDGTPAEDCHKLGFFELKDLEPVTGKPHRIDIRCRIDQNGMLNAVARDPATGQQEEMSLDYKSAG